MPEIANHGVNMSSFEPLYPKIVAALRRHRGLAVWVFLIVLTVAVGYTLLLPKEYESQMEILLTNERPDLIVSPSHGSDGSSNDTVSDTVDEVRVNSEIELLRSSDIMREVVVRCNLAGKHPSECAGPPTTSTVKTNDKAELRKIDKAELRLEHNLVIEPVQKTNLIRISYTSENPQLSVNVLSTLLVAYINKHLAVRGSETTYNFFQKQTAIFAKNLSDSRAELDAFHRLHPVTIGNEEDLLLRQKFETEAILNQTEESLKEATARVSFANYQATSSKIPARIVTDIKKVPNLQAVQQLTNTLINLQNNREELLNKFRSGDRAVKVIDEQIQQTSDALKRIIQTGATEESTAINPVKQTAKLEAARANLDLAGLKAKDNVLKMQFKIDDRKLQELEDASAKLSVLVTKVQQDESNYEVYSRKMEDAQVEDLLDTQRIANVTSVESPTPSDIPISPKIGLGLAISLLLAAFAAATAVFGAEMLETAKLMR